MSSASRYIPHYTVADYEQWEGNWELWDGHAIAMSPAPNVQHQRVARNLFLAIQQSLSDNEACHCELLYEVDWRVKQDTVVRPDLVLSCEPIAGNWLDHAPSLIAEVLSPSTRSHDLTYKRELYAREGVRHYLIVDPENKTIEPLLLERGNYSSRHSADGSVLMFDLHDGCRIAVDPAGLWK